jgi:hypothetical protein
MLVLLGKKGGYGFSRGGGASTANNDFGGNAIRELACHDDSPRE